MKITKAVIPAAGFGTRFLPQTKAMPKEMLPIVDKPVIQYVVEEVVQSGVENVIIVTGANKRAIEDHFDIPNEDLTKILFKETKNISLRRSRKSQIWLTLSMFAKRVLTEMEPLFSPLNQSIENEPFAVLWGDEFIYATPRLAQMIPVL
ncbi:NTP transferase domain-containing protein [Candidatus Roizmanbacteria bacterium]|nr:MAG: NTP transferase domain-containing protein [Candidatus Roizmanbacteria bacterium]